MLGRGLYFTMTKDRIERVHDLARRRIASADENEREATRELAGVDRYEGEVQGLLGESALAGWMEREFPGEVRWIGFTEHPNSDTPDVLVYGFSIDVKAARLDRHSLIAKHSPKHPNPRKRRRIHPLWAYVGVSIEHLPRCWIAGWAWGAQLLKHAEWRVEREDAGAYYAKLAELRGMYELVKGIRSKVEELRANRPA